MTSFLARIGFVAALGCSALGWAQSPGEPGKSNPRLDAAIQGKKDALELFKNGDKAGGLGKLKANVDKTAGSPKEEIQVNAQLAEISCWLANEQHPRAKEIALLTLDETDKSRSKLTASEQAAALAAMGEISELLVGDQAKARTSYEAALVLDAREATAQQGLARLNILTALIDAKTRETETLRLRALNPPR